MSDEEKQGPGKEISTELDSKSSENDSSHNEGKTSIGGNIGIAAGSDRIGEMDHDNEERPTVEATARTHDAPVGDDNVDVCPDRWTEKNSDEAVLHQSTTGQDAPNRYPTIEATERTDDGDDNGDVRLRTEENSDGAVLPQESTTEQDLPNRYQLTDDPLQVSNTSQTVSVCTLPLQLPHTADPFAQDLTTGVDSSMSEKDRILRNFTPSGRDANTADVNNQSLVQQLDDHLKSNNFPNALTSDMTSIENVAPHEQYLSNGHPKDAVAVLNEQEPLFGKPPEVEVEEAYCASDLGEMIEATQISNQGDAEVPTTTILGGAAAEVIEQNMVSCHGDATEVPGALSQEGASTSQSESAAELVTQLGSVVELGIKTTCDESGTVLEGNVTSDLDERAARLTPDEATYRLESAAEVVTETADGENGAVLDENVLCDQDQPDVQLHVPPDGTTSRSQVEVRKTADDDMGSVFPPDRVKSPVMLSPDKTTAVIDPIFDVEGDKYLTEDRQFVSQNGVDNESTRQDVGKFPKEQLDAGNNLQSNPKDVRLVQHNNNNLVPIERLDPVRIPSGEDRSADGTEETGVPATAGLRNATMHKVARSSLPTDAYGESTGQHFPPIVSPTLPRLSRSLPASMDETAAVASFAMGHQAPRGSGHIPRIPSHSESTRTNSRSMDGIKRTVPHSVRLPPSVMKMSTVMVSARKRAVLNRQASVFYEETQPRKIITLDEAINSRPPLPFDLDGPGPWNYSPRNKPLNETNAPEYSIATKFNEKGGGGRTAYAKTWFNSDSSYTQKVQWEKRWPSPAHYSSTRPLLGRRKPTMVDCPSFSIGVKSNFSISKRGSENEPSPNEYNRSKADALILRTAPSFTIRQRQNGTTLWTGKEPTPSPCRYSPHWGFSSSMVHHPSFTIRGVRRQKSHQLGPHSTL